MLALLAFSSVLPGCLADRTSWPKVNYWEEEGVAWNSRAGARVTKAAHRLKPQLEPPAAKARHRHSKKQDLLNKQGGVMGTEGGETLMPSVHTPDLAWHENDPKASKRDTVTCWVGGWVGDALPDALRPTHVFPSLGSSSCWYQFDLDT